MSSQKKPSSDLSRFEFHPSEADAWLRDLGIDPADDGTEEKQDGDTDRPPVEPAKPR